jgi:hypothetical protein
MVVKKIEELAKHKKTKQKGKVETNDFLPHKVLERWLS